MLGLEGASALEDRADLLQASKQFWGNIGEVGFCETITHSSRVVNDELPSVPRL
jgi:hypothetical protein